MNSKKKLAGKILKTSPSKVRFEEGALADIEKAITRSDIRGLIAVGKIYKSGENEQSRGRARKLLKQKRKGRRRNRGSKKGSKYSIVPRKEQWMIRIRAQREFIKELKDKELLSSANYHKIYAMCRGGYFRNVRHVKMFLNEHQMFDQKEQRENKENKK